MQPVSTIFANISETVHFRLSKRIVSTHKLPQTTQILVYEYLGLSEIHFWQIFNENRSNRTGNTQLKSVDAKTPAIWLKFNPDYFHRL